MKILHTADVHLDRSFEGLKGLPERVRTKLQVANQAVLTAIVDVAIKNQVDAVLLAGDTFHQNQPSVRTQAGFIKEMQRLEQEQIPVFLTFGNHDYYLPEKYWFDFPKNVYVFRSETVETHHFVTKRQEEVAISGFSYVHQWLNEQKLTEFPQREQSVAIHIGMYHGSQAMNDAQSYAPFSLAEMKRKGYDYWALGHIHQSQFLSEAPVILYPGTPQGHTKKERGVQGVALVTIESGTTQVQFVPVAKIVWEQRTCSLQQATNVTEALAMIENQLIESQETAEFQLLALQLVDTDHLDETFFLACQNGELIAYLRENIQQKIGDKLFLFQLDVVSNMQQKVRIQANPELVTQLEQNYLQPEIFANTLKELVQNPLFSTVIAVDESWRQQSIAQADQKIKETVIIQAIQEEQE